MRDFVIYTKSNCAHCVNAKKLMEVKGYDYSEIVIGEDITMEEFKERYPDVRTVPLIFSKDGRVGGFSDLKIHIA